MMMVLNKNNHPVRVSPLRLTQRAELVFSITSGYTNTNWSGSLSGRLASSSRLAERCRSTITLSDPSSRPGGAAEAVHGGACLSYCPSAELRGFADHADRSGKLWTSAIGHRWDPVGGCHEQSSWRP